MSNQYNESQKNLTTASILGSLLIKMKEKPLSKISVSEICKLAGVSRMAFYRHFEDLGDVLSIHLEERFESFFKEVSAIDLSSSYQSSLVLCHYIIEERAFYEVLVESGYESLLYQYFENFMTYILRNVDFGYHLEGDDINYYAAYRSGGIVKLIITWIRQGFQASPDHIAELLTQFDINQH
ncbi:TetR/AcrR family transcriptional regulator [Acidaminobacter sp. JC074]|uniref:TetR-like C-terminal domain-containing protein n=1 Tax=Acidaminobacter sp. JC074 TaxID=2530199 RepID=UPI001F0E0256|nr:TetR/AcrR family transcriptional regulator [Acidaminobacter sp. JC074]MCH4889551.1 TetR/AcrR family transcriptional regulator [Acidaminobacter sp. JC074]